MSPTRVKTDPNLEVSFAELSRLAKFQFNQIGDLLVPMFKSARLVDIFRQAALDMSGTSLKMEFVLRHGSMRNMNWPTL